MGRLQHVLGWVFLLALGATAAHAQPFIFYRGIVNAASFAPQGLPNGSIARGSIFSIFGRNLGPAQGATVSEFPLGTNFQGVSIEVCQNANCVAALPLFVSAAQVNAIMPSNAPLGAVSMRATFNGQAGNFSPARVSDSSFGIFTINSGGFGPGVVQNFTPEALPVNSAVVTARPGQTMIAWGTGLGAGLNADNVAPQSGDLPTNVEIWAGGKKVTVKRYSGRSPCCAGVDQIIFDLPPDTPTGCYVPIQIRTGGQVVSNSISMSMSADGSPCADSANPLSAALPGGRVGVVLLNRFHTTSTLPLNMGIEFTADFLAAIFQNEPAGPWHFNRLYSLPPPGACATYTAQGAALTGGLLAGLAASGPALSAGAQVSVTGPLRSANAPPLASAGNFYGALLGTDLSLEPLMSLFLGDGAHRVRAAGGAQVGAFQIDVTPPPRLTWTNRNSFGTATRGAPLEVTWTGGDAQGLAVVLGFSRAPLTLSAAGFVCVERAAQGRLSIPDWATAHLPDGGSGEADGFLAITALPAIATSVPAAGLDFGFGLFTSGQIQGVDFK